MRPYGQNVGVELVVQSSAGITVAADTLVLLACTNFVLIFESGHTILKYLVDTHLRTRKIEFVRSEVTDVSMSHTFSAISSSSSWTSGAEVHHCPRCLTGYRRADVPAMLSMGETEAAT